MSFNRTLTGTDTIAGVSYARTYYGCPMAGYSIPAAEHRCFSKSFVDAKSYITSSTVTSWGKDGEVDAFRNMLTKFPTGLVAVVSDSYNIWCVWFGRM